MIEVLLSNGDRAECETPEEAVFAARTLMDDAWEANPVQGNHPTVTFLVDGRAVRSNLTRAEVMGANGGAR